MLMVIWAHCGIGGSPIINYFHMPLFFFISGYLFKDRTFWSFLSRKLKSLYVPFVIYEIVFLIFRNIFLNMRLYTTAKWSWMEPVTKNNIVDLVIHIVSFDNIDELLSTLWFPMALFAVEIVYLLLMKCCKNEWIRFALSFGLLLLGYFLCWKGIQINYSYNFDRKISVILISVWFYCFGDFVKRKRGINFEGLISRRQIILALIFSVVLFVAYRLYIYTDYRACSYSNPLISFLLACIGIYVSITFGIIIYNTFCRCKMGIVINNLLREIGILSFHFMALQFLAMKPVSFIIAKLMRKDPLEYVGDFGVTTIANQPMRFAAFVIVGVECYIVSVLICKIKLLVFDMSHKQR